MLQTTRAKAEPRPRPPRATAPRTVPQPKPPIRPKRPNPRKPKRRRPRSTKPDQAALRPGGRGTFSPFLRALESPIAIACRRFLTGCLPSRMWCISVRTSSPALLSYLRSLGLFLDFVLAAISCLPRYKLGGNYAARRALALLRAAAIPTTRASLRLLARRLAAPCPARLLRAAVSPTSRAALRLLDPRLAAPAATRLLRARASPTARAALRLLDRRLATPCPNPVLFLAFMLIPPMYIYKTATPSWRLAHV